MADTNGHVVAANLVRAPVPQARLAPSRFLRRLAGSLNSRLRIVATEAESAAFARVERELDELDRLRARRP